jgi:hypothetical protein
MAKIYGTNVAIFGKSFEIAGLIDRHLEIYGTKTKFKLVMFRSTQKGWHKKHNIVAYKELMKPTTPVELMKLVNELGFDKTNLLWKDINFEIE